MARIIAELAYWSFGEFSRNAMVHRLEVTAPDVEKIAERYAVNVEVIQASSYYFMFGRMPGQYRKIIVRVGGDGEKDVRGCVREIVLVFGRPDEVPFSFSTARRAGKAIVDSLLREYPSR